MYRASGLARRGRADGSGVDPPVFAVVGRHGDPREVRRPRPSPSQLLMDMKLMYWFFPTETPAVGMIPFSDGAHLVLLMICFESPDPIAVSRSIGWRPAVGHADRLGQRAVLAAEQRVVPPLLAADAAIAVRVAEGHQHLRPRIAVVPHDPEVGPGDGELLTVSFGLSGPVTQPISYVPGAGGAGRRWERRPEQARAERRGTAGSPDREDWEPASPPLAVAPARCVA